MDIKEIAKKIDENGGAIYLVGGAVRDKLLGLEVHDEDYCITKMDEKTFERLFPMAKKKGKSFPVYEIDKKEFAMARKEKKNGKKHQDFEVDVGKDITIEEDLQRRDITINSMAIEVLSGKMIDPFGGEEDLKNKVIRATSKAFIEDALRVYRVARFASCLDFNVEEETLKQMEQMKEELLELPKERVFEEFRKALSCKKPSIFFEVLKKANLLSVHFKEIYDLIGSIQPEKYHPEGDSYAHTLIVVDEAAKRADKLEIRYSALVHDLGKGTTPKELYPHHYGHEERGVELAKKLGERIGVPKSWTSCAKVACKDHMRGGIFSKMSITKQVGFIERIEKSSLGLEGMQIVVDSDKNGRNKIEDRFLEIGKECLKEIDGKYIKRKYGDLPGEEFKQKLHQERTEWLKRKIENR